MYELYDGYVLAFSTGTGAHGLLCTRISTLLDTHPIHRVARLVLQLSVYVVLIALRTSYLTVLSLAKNAMTAARTFSHRTHRRSDFFWPIGKTRSYRQA